MIYYLRIICSIVTVVVFILALILSIVGCTNVSKKSKSILANIVTILMIISGVFMIGLIITDGVYNNKIQSSIKSRHKDAHRFNNISNKGDLNMFESNGTYYKWTYNAKSNTIIIEGINLDFIEEINDAI